MSVEKHERASEEQFFNEVRTHLDNDPVAGFLDAVVGRVMEAAEEVNRRIGPLDDRAYAAVVTVLCDSAVRQMAESLQRRSK